MHAYTSHYAIHNLKKAYLREYKKQTPRCRAPIIIPERLKTCTSWRKKYKTLRKTDKQLFRQLIKCLRV